MVLEINKIFSSNVSVDPMDVTRVKKSLNRLGYYVPPEESGITNIPDFEIFQALRQFQENHDLAISGELRPDDRTVRKINQELSKPIKGQYIWRTSGDDKVRPDHKALNWTVRNWENSPDPGEEINCRCWAWPVEEGLRPVYPEFLLIPALKAGRIVASIRGYFAFFRKSGATAHGNQRAKQRGISDKEIREAIRSAKKSGNVETKTGKYGTSQNHYKGKNGVTVIEETEGKNAGKIITVWRHK